jgi:Ca2+/Na+ antiporter
MPEEKYEEPESEKEEPKSEQERALADVERRFWERAAKAQNKAAESNDSPEMTDEELEELEAALARAEEAAEIPAFHEQVNEYTERPREASAELRPARRQLEPLKSDLDQFRDSVNSALVLYSRLPARLRFRVTEPSTLYSQAMVFAGFVVWGVQLFRPLARFGLLLVSPAYAADSVASGPTPKDLIHFGIFVALFITYGLSIYVQYFGKNTKAVDSAGTVSKTLLGFFIGAATNYLGIGG